MHNTILQWRKERPTHDGLFIVKIENEMFQSFEMLEVTIDNKGIMWVNCPCGSMPAGTLSPRVDEYWAELI